MFVRDTPGGPDLAVYVHGLGGSSSNWTSLAGLLAGRAAGLSIDLPGSGRSDPPTRGDYTIHARLRTLTNVVEHCGRPVHLVGNSYGGALGVLLAAARPDLLSSLTLIAPAVPDLRMSTDRGADPRLAAVLLPGVSGWAQAQLSRIDSRSRVEGMVQLCFGDPTAVASTDLAAGIAEAEWRRDLPWTQTALLAELRGLVAEHLQVRPPFWTVARQVRVPTLVVWGTRDRLVDPRLARKTVESIAGSTLRVLPGIGHVPQMEAPVATAAAVGWHWDRLRQRDTSSAAEPDPAIAVATFVR